MSKSDYKNWNNYLIIVLYVSTIIMIEYLTILLASILLQILNPIKYNNVIITITFVWGALTLLSYNPLLFIIYIYLWENN